MNTRSQEENQEFHVPSVFSLGITLVLSWALLFFALIQRNLTLAVLCSGILLLMHGTRMWSRRSLRRLTIAVSVDRERLFPGDSLTLDTTISNNKFLPVWARIELFASELFTGDMTSRGETFLLSYQKRSKSILYTARQRGVYPGWSAQLTTGDLLGLHTRSLSSILPREIIIFPRLGVLHPIELPFQEFFGIHASRGMLEDPARYEGTRDYQGNRSAKTINWKASARLGKLQENIYEPTSHRKVLFILDAAGFADLAQNSVDPSRTEQDAAADRFEHILSIVATMAATLAETGASLGFLTNARLTGSVNQLLPFGRGPEHLGTLLSMLARVTRDTSGNLSPLLKESWSSCTGTVFLGSRPPEQPKEIVSLLPARRGRRIFIFAHSSSARLLESPGWDGYNAYPACEVMDAE